jgi:hypothetical protein
MTDSKRGPDGFYIRPLKLRSVRRYAAESYHFTFDHWGWVTFIIDDALGELSVQSDWGCWGHRWNPDHLGPSHNGSLKHFLSHSGRCYVANKLSYCMPTDQREVPDLETTEEEIKKRILEARRAREIDADDARDLWSDAEYTVSAYESGHDAAYHAMSDELSNFLEDTWEYFATKDSPNLVILRERLLPFLQDELQKEFSGQQEA